MSGQPRPKVKRVYDDPATDDGLRVLVDRIWPRGLSKERAHVDEWLKAVAPSTQLRTWYAHDADRFEEFARRYKAELETPERAEAFERLKQLAKSSKVTLLTATKEVSISQAAVLATLLR